jgi:hypothetical protein
MRAELASPSGGTARAEPVLMLVPYFAPQTHAAMFRAHKLAKYLPERGFTPIVVTVDVNYLYNEDPGLLQELPPSVQVHRARFVEPTVRGIRMALGGRDRTFVAMKTSHAPPVPGSVASAATARSRKRWSTTELVRLLGEWPDRHWTWSMCALRLCRRLIAEHNIRLLYTSAVPVSPLRTALRLKREFGMGWVADFRDPVGYGQKHTARGILAAELERRTLARTMAEADAVTGLSESYGRIFFDLFGLADSRYEFIPTGLDEDYLEAQPAPDADSENMFLHVGEVMPNQSERSLSILSIAHRQHPDEMRGARLVFFGRREINQPLVAAMTASIAGWSIPIEYIDHVPQREVYRLIRRARACLLAPGPNGYWWNNFAKLVDYIALRAPVIADVPTTSEARTELTRAGLGHFLESGTLAEEACRLAGWLVGGNGGQSIAYAERYTARVQADSFTRVFNRVLSGVRL